MPTDQPRVVLMSPPELPRRPKKRLFLTVGIGTAIWALPLALIVAFVIVPSSARPTSAVPAAASAVASVPSAQAPAPASTAPAPPAASTAPAPPDRPLLWLNGLQSLESSINSATGEVLRQTPTALRSQARELSRCSSELARLGPPTGQLQSVDRLARRSCTDFKRAAVCAAAAARAHNKPGMRSARPNSAFVRLTNCEMAGLNKGYLLLSTAIADTEFIQ
jgi:hypothetical protein